MSGPFTGGLGVDPLVLDHLARTLGSHFDEEQRVYPLGHRDIGSNRSIITFRASRATLYVRYHVQHSGQKNTSTRGLFTRGLGRHETKGLYCRGIGIGPDGRAEYNPANVYAEGQVDCREERQQKVTITRDGTNAFVVWLIPEFLEADGSFTKFDGDDADDRMAVVDLGV